MQWIDGSEIDVEQYTGAALCEKLSLEMWGYNMEQCLDWADHELKAEVAERITELSRKQYLYTDLDMWELLFRFMDRKIAAL